MASSSFSFSSIPLTFLFLRQRILSNPPSSPFLLRSTSLSTMSANKQTFYLDPNSGNAWRVSIYIHEKKLSPEIKKISLAKGEHKQPEYLAINPRGQVPAWQDGENIIYESLGIMMYLESQHKENPLIPANAKDQALFYTRLFQFPAKLDNHSIFGSVVFGKQGKEQLKAKIADKLKEYEKWNQALEGHEYLANSFSVADIAILPSVTTDVELLGLDLTQFPHLNAWYKRVWQRPSVKETCTFVEGFKAFPFEKVLDDAKL